MTVFGRPVQVDWTAVLLLSVLSASYLYLFVYFPDLNNPNENVRVYTTRALVEGGTPSIGERTWDPVTEEFVDVGGPTGDWGWVNDRALICDDPTAHPPDCTGRLYAAKAPLMSYLGVPVYRVLNMVSPSPDLATCVYWLRICCVIAPTVAFLLLFYVFLGRYTQSRWVRSAVTTFYAVGTMSFTYGQLFAGHQPAALALFSAFMVISLIRDSEGSAPWWWHTGLGFLLALSVGFEYPSVFPAAALSVLGFRREGAFRFWLSHIR